MDGRVDVGCDGGFTAPTAAAPYATSTLGCPTASLTADTNATLTIAPGVILIGAPGASWLAINRGNKINAVGTATNPIIFTSRDNLQGLNTETSQGQWGGRGAARPRAGHRLHHRHHRLGAIASGRPKGSVNPSRFGGATTAPTTPA